MGIGTPTLLLICSAILLLGSSIFATEARTSEQILFEDNFESHNTGTFPSSAWQLWFSGNGIAYQTVDNFFNDSYAKSLRLLGTSGYSAVAAHNIVSDSPIIGFNVSVRVDQIGGRIRDTARVGFAELSSSFVSTDYAPIWFQDNGSITCMNKVLQSYVPGRWYGIMSIIDRSKETYSVWIDDVLVGENMTVTTNRGELEAGETAWNIGAFALNQNYYSAYAYFDDVAVFSVFDLDPKLELEPSRGFSSITLVGSGFAPGSMIAVSWNSVKMNTVPSPLVASTYGNFTGIVSALNQTTNGIYILKGVDSMGNEATADFEVALPALTPTSTPTPSTTPSHSPSNIPSLIPTISPSLSPSPSITPKPTLEPTQSATPTAHDIQAEEFTPEIIILVLATVAVVICVLVYLAKHKGWK